MKKSDLEKIKENVGSQFQTKGDVRELIPFGNGHINDTYRMVCRRKTGETKRYILQRMNDKIFKNPFDLMENIVNVTAFLKRKIAEAGGDTERETLTVIPTMDGRNFYTDENGDNWRLFLFIENASCLETVRSPEDFYHSGAAFGNFQRLLADYPVDTLHETICNFHNTPSRFSDFEKAVQEDICGRRKEVEREIQFIRDRERDCHIIQDSLESGTIPLRVTHNDTKLNNIMMDNHTGKGICIIDLDTVMPGSALHDYGDSIRFGASTASEDEQNLELVSCDLNLVEAYTKGYIESCGKSLTKKEIQLLPMGAKIMTLECGIRFLTDYLQNDSYFKIQRKQHNLDRARSQLKLVADMESKWEHMNAIALKYLES